MKISQTSSGKAMQLDGEASSDVRVDDGSRVSHDAAASVSLEHPDKSSHRPFDRCCNRERDYSQCWT